MNEIITHPPIKNISNRIPPNYSTWATIEYSYAYAKYLIHEGIPGDFVECGVAAGNNLAAMCAAGRHGYGFDSFLGIPWAGPKDDEQPGIGPKPEVMEGISSGITVHTKQNVEKDMAKWGITNYTLIEGWFSDTLPVNDIGPIALLRLDADLYDSTRLALKYLFPKLSPGGILIMDDWRLAGCRRAFNEYFMGKYVEEDFIYDEVVYFRKQ